MSSSSGYGSTEATESYLLRIRICNTDEIYFLEFNSNLLTFLQVEESPLKDEIQSGSIVVGEAAPAQAQHRPSKGARKRKS